MKSSARWGWCSLSLAVLVSSNLLAMQKVTWVHGRVSRNVDGDTIWVQPDRSDSPTNEADGKPLKIRMLSIDAPETHFPAENGAVVGQGKYGEVAASRLAALIPLGTRVLIKDEGLDKYNRTLGRVFLRNGDINLAMVKEGWAITYFICDGEKCTKNYFKNEEVEKYVTSCEQAKEKGLGIFNPKDPLREMPF